MASMILGCPSCNRKLRVTDELVGKEVKCPTCGTTFQATADLWTSQQALSQGEQGQPTAEWKQATSKPGETGANASKESSSTESHGQTERAGSLQPCPFCGEPIAADSTRCPSCQETIEGDEDDRPWETQAPFTGRRDSEPHRGTLILILGILSLVVFPVGLPLGITALLMGRRDLKKIRSNAMDPAGEGTTLAGWICGIIGTGVGSLFCLGITVYIAFIAVMVKSLVNTPPAPVKQKLGAPPIAPPQKQTRADVPPKNLIDYKARFRLQASVAPRPSKDAIFMLGGLEHGQPPMFEMFSTGLFRVERRAEIALAKVWKDDDNQLAGEVRALGHLHRRPSGGAATDPA